VVTVHNENLDVFSQEQLIKYQTSDPAIKIIYQWKVAGEKPDWYEVSPRSSEIKFYYHLWGKSSSERWCAI
jgi:hypothetical protein